MPRLTALDSSMNGLWPLATVACLGLGSYRVLNGSLSVGGLVAFMWYVQWVIHRSARFQTINPKFNKALYLWNALTNCWRCIRKTVKLLMKEASKSIYALRMYPTTIKLEIVRGSAKSIYR